MDFLLAFCGGYDFCRAIDCFGKKDWNWGFAFLGVAILCGVAYFT
jgi:hypothetical protein